MGGNASTVQYHYTVGALFVRGYLFRAAAKSAAGFGRPEVNRRTTPKRRFFVPALWRAVRGAPSGAPGTYSPVDQPAYGSPLQ